MTTNTHTFRAGDIVRLRHIDFHMTVENVQDRRICGELVGQSVDCVWFTKEGELRREQLNSRCLVLVRANRD